MNQLSIVIPTLNSETTLANTISSVFRKGKVYVIDGGSSDGTVDIAKHFNAEVRSTLPSRGLQLSTGASLIHEGWILFIHSDTILSKDWYLETLKFIKKPDSEKNAAYFKFKFDDNGFFSKIFEAGVDFRCRFFSLPYGDQCLLIHSSLYKKIGGFRPISLMEDIDLISRLNRKNLYKISVFAVTSAYKYKSKGYIYTATKNLLCLFMFKLGFPVNLIKSIYDS